MSAWRGWEAVAKESRERRGRRAVAVPAAGFGALLHGHRTKRGLSQSALGKLAGCDATVISNYERGTRNPTRDTLTGIAAALGLSEAETDALLVAGGLAPRQEDAYLIGDPDVALVARLLADPGVSAEQKQRVRQTVALAVAMVREG